MNATDTAYNPFRAAAAAAFAELSSEQAHRYYSLKAQKDVQTILDTSITLCAWAFQLAQLTYMMGAQCRTWCDALETNAQAPARSMLMLAPAQVEDEAPEDPWEAESDYELVEFSPSIAAQAFTSPMLLLAPASTVVCGSVWNPAPKDMHTEVERLLALQSVPLLLAPAPAQEQPAPEPVKQPTRRGRGQTRAVAAPANADELATGGQTGAKASISKAKGGNRNARANAKPKNGKGDAEAVAIASHKKIAPRRRRKATG